MSTLYSQTLFTNTLDLQSYHNIKYKVIFAYIKQRAKLYEFFRSHRGNNQVSALTDVTPCTLIAYYILTERNFQLKLQSFTYFKIQDGQRMNIN
jgi:hypothetical protein